MQNHLGVCISIMQTESFDGFSIWSLAKAGDSFLCCAVAQLLQCSFTDVFAHTVSSQCPYMLKCWYIFNHFVAFCKVLLLWSLFPLNLIAVQLHLRLSVVPICIQFSPQKDTELGIFLPESTSSSFNVIFHPAYCIAADGNWQTRLKSS